MFSKYSFLVLPRLFVSSITPIRVDYQSTVMQSTQVTEEVHLPFCQVWKMSAFIPSRFLTSTLVILWVSWIF